jgi:hypothetical protein
MSCVKKQSECWQTSAMLLSLVRSGTRLLRPWTIPVSRHERLARLLSDEHLEVQRKKEQTSQRSNELRKAGLSPYLESFC